MKLIALDLDGTLLNNKSIISNENADAIRYAQNKGVEVTISTGRLILMYVLYVKSKYIYTYNWK